MITIRQYKPEDAQALWEVFFFTVRNINIQHYSQQQVEAWAPDNWNQEVWQEIMLQISPYIAEIDGQVAGYTDLQDSGLIDHFFCHYKFQGKGVGRAMMEYVIEQSKQRGISRLYSEVSITARPFYERMGFNLVREQQVEMRGQLMTNFVMELSSLPK
ncbi:GNAT family N-acetyltransferase [Vibrio sp. OCN044]|uniref:GNAT family N-acetyltransferase n=1 Tax=Vibrio tetraodonis subsp. pristinus TaxID=2695891 RepID=A0A6L8LQT2_9VIBR|nr:GNAT family N-acetyltransferase [Vibrio tetraodonis]MYM58368.1 GNAT family N-acetyltransferase [Vibrio tetraodonis subsp. pristinus]